MITRAKYWHDTCRSDQGFRYVVFDGQVPAFGNDGYSSYESAHLAGRAHAVRLQSAWDDARPIEDQRGEDE